MTAETFDEYIVKTFRMYAREKGIDLKSIALGSLESGKDIDDCETDFNWKLRDHVYDFKKVIGQYMADDVESAVLSSIELGDVIDLDDYFDDDGIAYSPRPRKSSGRKTPAFMSASTKPRNFRDLLVWYFRKYARDNGIDLEQLAYDALKTGKRDVVCERNFQRKLKGYSKDFEKVIGQYMSYQIEHAVLSSIELGDYIDMDEYFDDEGVAYNSKTKKSSGKKASTPRSVNKPAKPRGKAAPASKSPKLRYFKPGMNPDDMAEVIAEELTRCGLDKEYDSNWDVFDDCYWYMSTGEREDFVEWANEVRPKCPKAAAMIE